MPTLNEALGSAYHLHASGDYPAALKQIKEAVAIDRGGAEARLAELAGIVRARTQGGRCHAHIEKVGHDLIEEALRSP